MIPWRWAGAAAQLPRPGRCLASAGLVAALVLSPALAAHAFWDGVSQGSAVVSKGTGLRITGYEQEAVLAPGQSSQLAVQVANRAERPTMVTAAELSRATGAQLQGCPFDALSLSQPPELPATIPARSSVRLVLSVSLSPEASTACQRAAIPLRIRLRTATR